jgi:hypothetical protein
LAFESVRLDAPAIQRIKNDNEIGNCYRRRLRLNQQQADQASNSRPNNVRIVTISFVVLTQGDTGVCPRPVLPVAICLAALAPPAWRGMAQDSGHVLISASPL